MPFPTITEKYGTLTCRMPPPDTVFGIPVAPTSFLPMNAGDLEMDPGWFSPKLWDEALGVRSLHLPFEPGTQAPDDTLTA